MSTVRHWTAEEDEALYLSTIKELLKTDEEFGREIGRSASAVRQRRQRLLRYTKPRAAKARQAALNPGRHPKQDTWQQNYYDRGAGQATIVGVYWNELEDELILSPDRPCDRDLAKQLRRPIRAIHNRRRLLKTKGIRCPRRRHPVPEIEKLRVAA